MKKFYKKHFSFFIKLSPNKFKCTCCNKYKITIDKHKVNEYLICENCKQSNVVISKNKVVEFSYLLKDSFYFITYKYGNGYKIFQKKVIKYDQNNKVTHIRNLRNSMGYIFYDIEKNNWREYKNLRTIYYYDNDYYIMRGFNFCSRNIDKLRLKQIKKYNADKYIDTDKLMNFININFQRTNFTVLEHLIKLTNDYYVQLYLDENYNILEFNKHDRKFILQHELNTQQLEVFKQMKIQNIKKIDNYIITNKDLINLKNFNDILIKYSNIFFRQFKGLFFELPVTPKDLRHDGNILHHCVGGYADKINSNNFIFFARYNENRPYATIEISNRKVQQIRTFKNKSVSDKNKKIILEFLKENKIIK